MGIFQNIPTDNGGDTIRAAQKEIINRANANHLTADGWSLAELSPDDNDFEWLLAWAKALDEETATRWLLPGQTAAFWGNPQTRRAGLGVLLMMLAAEQKRRGLVDDKNWLMALSASFNEPARKIIFNEDALAPPSIGSLKEASSRLRLRVNEGWDSFTAQRESIALQIGLTETDLTENLPVWLGGQDVPEHICALLDPVHGSDSFLHLWQSCCDYIQGFQNESELTETLSTSVWILPRWVHTIITTLQPLRLEPTGSSSTVKSASTGSLTEPHNEPEDVFGAFMPYGGIKTIIRGVCAMLARADHLKLRDQPWSLTDLKLSDYDYAWLRVWVTRLEPETVSHIAETERQFTTEETSISLRAALGALLGLWIADTARRGENGNDELWSFISSDSFKPAVAAELFRQNQPSSFLRVLLTDAARELNLRDTLPASTS